jgi:putative RecB family exonuclease
MAGLPSGYLSVSQINKYMNCPKQYEFSYIQGIPESKSSALVVGSSFHKVIEESNRRKLETGELLPEEEMQAIYDEYWHKKNIDIDWKEEEDQEAEYQRGLLMAQAYMNDIGKQLEPIGYEARFDVEVEGIPLIGYIDLIEKDGSIRDLKTSRKSPAKDMADKSLQLTGYALAYRELTGEEERVCSLDYVVSLKSGVKITRLETKVSEGRIDRFKDTLWNVANAIDKEVFYRNEGTACSWCSYKSICKGGEE